MRRFIILLMMIAGLIITGCSTKQGPASEELLARLARQEKTFEKFEKSRVECNASLEAMHKDRARIIQFADKRVNDITIALNKAIQERIESEKAGNDKAHAALREANGARDKQAAAESKLRIAITEMTRIKNKSVAEAKNQSDRYDKGSRENELQATRADQAKEFKWQERAKHIREQVQSMDRELQRVQWNQQQLEQRAKSGAKGTSEQIKRSWTDLITAYKRSLPTTTEPEIVAAFGRNITEAEHALKQIHTPKQEQIIAPVGPLIAAAGIPEFTNIKAMAMRISEIQHELAYASSNGIRFQGKVSEIQKQLGPCVGHTIAWQWRVQSIRPAGVDRFGQPDPQSNAKVLLYSQSQAWGELGEIGSLAQGIRLEKREDNEAFEYLEVGKSISKEYASALSAKDIIKIRGVITACALDQYRVVTIRIGQPVAVDPSSTK
jgi:hypothetical protein